MDTSALVYITRTVVVLDWVHSNTIRHNNIGKLYYARLDFISRDR